MSENTAIDWKDIPSGDHVVFQNKLPPGVLSLPSAAEVCDVARQSGDLKAGCGPRHPPVKFPALRLLVKYGSQVSIAEAQCLLFVRKHVPTVPVPDVYGWRRDGGQNFIYMELLEGPTLQESWADLGEEERVEICQELRQMVESWRALPQELAGVGDDGPFIGVPTPPLLSPSLLGSPFFLCLGSPLTSELCLLADLRPLRRRKRPRTTLAGLDLRRQQHTNPGTLPIGLGVPRLFHSQFWPEEEGASRRPRTASVPLHAARRCAHRLHARRPPPKQHHTITAEGGLSPASDCGRRLAAVWMVPSVLGVLQVSLDRGVWRTLGEEVPPPDHRCHRLLRLLGLLRSGVRHVEKRWAERCRYVLITVHA